MTFYLAEKESWFSSIQTEEMSFGLPYLKKHMLNCMVLMNIYRYAKASIQVSFISDLLQGGRCSDAMVDFTGGCPESFELSLEKRMENLFSSMKKNLTVSPLCVAPSYPKIQIILKSKLLWDWSWDMPTQ